MNICFDHFLFHLVPRVLARNDESQYYDCQDSFHMGLTLSYWGTDAGGKGVRAFGADGNWNKNIGGASRTERRTIQNIHYTSQSANS